MTPPPSTFTRTLSLTVHELRTPITVVGGYLRMLLKEHAGPLTDKQKQMLEEADRSCERIGALLSQMSELSRLESGDLAIARQDFDLADALHAVTSRLQEGEDRGVRLELRGVDRPILLTGDRARLSAALQALMHSALRERGAPGAIVIDCITSVQSEPAAGWVVIRIGDEDAQRTLGAEPPADASFDEFRGGLGLALLLARRVIAAHGGTIWSGPGDHPRAGAAVRLPVKA